MSLVWKNAVPVMQCYCHVCQGGSTKPGADASRAPPPSCGLGAFFHVRDMGTCPLIFFIPKANENGGDQSPCTGKIKSRCQPHCRIQHAGKKRSGEHADRVQRLIHPIAVARFSCGMVSIAFFRNRILSIQYVILVTIIRILIFSGLSYSTSFLFY
jgi:hypothetical protein